MNEMVWVGLKKKHFGSEINCTKGLNMKKGKLLRIGLKFWNE